MSDPNTYTDKQIDRLIQSFLSLSNGVTNLDRAERLLASASACGDASSNCGQRSGEYKAAREHGLHCLQDLISAFKAELPK